VFDVNADGVSLHSFNVLGPTDTHIAGIELVDVNICSILLNDCSGECYNGIHLGGTAADNYIGGNYCHGNTRRGISVRDTAHNNEICENTVEDNGDAGFCIKDQTFDNLIWRNNIIGDRVEILTSNTFNSPVPVSYSYNGSTYTSYIGNYYSDYTGFDADGNGIGETPYSFGTYYDSCPLMGEWFNNNIIVPDVAPVADFTADVQSGTAPLTVWFTDQSANSPTSWAWDFDNNGSIDSYDQNPVYLYLSTGTYTVKLTVTNDYGSDDEIKTNYITVNPPPPPVANFFANPTSGGYPLLVQFTDQSTGSAMSLAWDFDNDGTVDDDVPFPIHIYTTPGTYTVKLTATNAGGSDDEIKTDYIIVTTDVNPQPDWDLNGDHICNIGDVVKVGLKWGLTGTPGWIPEDLNNDGVINIGDIVVLGLHWNEAW
jgi:PKD repeat protein